MTAFPRWLGILTAVGVLLAVTVRCAAGIMASGGEGGASGVLGVALMVFVPLAVVLCVACAVFGLERLAADMPKYGGVVRVFGIVGLVWAALGELGVYLFDWDTGATVTVGVAGLWVALIAFVAGSR